MLTSKSTIRESSTGKNDLSVETRVLRLNDNAIIDTEDCRNSEEDSYL